ncbi:MAG: C69 family dipeptidase [Bacteroidales bacterium]|nr:C69 family dipeptidase [Bacteroidales bacterium]
MKRVTNYIFAFTAVMLLTATVADACTNFLITRGASKDGSTMVTYSADSHVLFGELYFWPARKWPAGSLLDVYEWDTGKFLGKIAQVPSTYSVVGNMNEHQLVIGETTYGGRPELGNSQGIMDYGSLIYITLQRAKTAREAIATIVKLTDEYGYYSSGESFSIADKEEVWIMELIGKGEGKKGILWVARRVPDGYISGHANQARITTFPLADGKISITSKDIDKIFDPSVENAYAADVIEVAREMGWYTGADKDFSFSDTYAPVDFGAARFCDARVWSGFNKVNNQMGKYLDYAMGYELENRMPLWIKPDNKLSVRDVMNMMRDYYQNTPMDMTKDLGAGPYGSTVRWRPMQYEVDGETYIQERAISTQQTGFSFVSQSRNWLPDPVGGLLWFGVDDTYFTVYTPMYCGMTSVPSSFAVGNGDMMTFSETSAFWVFNQLTDFAYSRTRLVKDEIQAKQDELENGYIEAIAETDRMALQLYEKKPKKAISYITEYSVNAGNSTVAQWKDFYRFLFTKYVDGNVKTAVPVPDGYNRVNPKVVQPGYGEEWNRRVARDAGDKLKMKK